jgi:hypothetical protein
MTGHATADPGLAERKLFVASKLSGQLVDQLDRLECELADEPLWVEIADFLRSSLPYIRSARRTRGHLLQIQRPEPVARAMAGFMERNPVEATLMENTATQAGFVAE